MVFAASCGGDDQTTIVTETVTERAKPALADAKTPSPDEVRNIRADCRITTVAIQKRPRVVRKPFFCKKASRKHLRALPDSPFAAKDECRLDVETSSMYRGTDYASPVLLSEAWTQFSPKCKRIGFVVYALSDEDIADYPREAPIDPAPLSPGQKGFYVTGDPSLLKYHQEYGKLSGQAQ